MAINLTHITLGQVTYASLNQLFYPVATPEEVRGVHRPKRRKCDNKAEVKSPNIVNNYNISSRKYRQMVGALFLVP